MPKNRRGNVAQPPPKQLKPSARVREPAKHGRELCRYNFPFGRKWQGKPYAIKQVAPVIMEKTDEIVVITVYTFYF